jgi:hypothetical protein
MNNRGEGAPKAMREYEAAIEAWFVDHAPFAGLADC